MATCGCDISLQAASSLRQRQKYGEEPEIMTARDRTLYGLLINKAKSPSLSPVVT